MTSSVTAAISSPNVVLICFFPRMLTTFALFVAPLFG